MAPYVVESCALDPLFENVARDIGGNFIGIEFMPGWRLGLGRHVYKLVRRVEDADSAGQLLNHLANFAPEDDGPRIAEARSICSDGLILIGGPDYSEKIRCRELV